MPTRRRTTLVFATLLLALAGCGSSSQVEVYGTVTANGKDLEDGFVSFSPLDDRNPTYGAPIARGRYRAKVNPGKYAVTVSGGSTAAYPKSQAELKNIPDKDLELSGQVPSDAKGNGQKVEITAGGQELNIALVYSTRRK
jgi:hypothetical protein